MEKTKKSTRKAKASPSAAALIAAYQEYLLMHGKQPSTVYKFCTELGLKEADFYKVAGSFEALEKLIWLDYIQKTISRLEGDGDYVNFSAREKLLAFYFTLAETLKANRSFCVLLLSRHSRLEVVPGFLKPFKNKFEEFVGQLLNDGKSKGEVAERPYLDKRYPQLFWVHLSLLLLFWKDDDSADFEKTDAFIEKSVNLAFDLIGKGALDSAIDFGKFLYQSRMN
ncbi:MAG: TetR/AcrR family transcriptional regulator [Cyclobacteriaceae bacterium]|nr:TetR/AcrR family transcriptional regulator [Cyclobacteriaceae bacterium]UYN85213.1 MAG: TetR/AcrR family transcriptional regulator [Cyclobacteriaceae bacterium]